MSPYKNNSVLGIMNTVTNIRCKVSADPSAHIKWYRNGKELNFRDYHNATTQNTDNESILQVQHSCCVLVVGIKKSHHWLSICMFSFTYWIENTSVITPARLKIRWVLPPKYLPLRKVNYRMCQRWVWEAVKAILCSLISHRIIRKNWLITSYCIRSQTKLIPHPGSRTLSI